jgi:hypothetical protein
MDRQMAANLDQWLTTETEAQFVCWDSDEDDAQGFTTHDFREDDGYCDRCEYQADTCVYSWSYTSMDSIGPEWDECGETAAWRAIRNCRSPLPLCDQHKRDWEKGKLDFELAPKGDVLLRIDPYDPLTGEDRFAEDASWHTTNEEGTACRCDPQPKTKWERSDAGLIWDWDDTNE